MKAKNLLRNKKAYRKCSHAGHTGRILSGVGQQLIFVSWLADRQGLLHEAELLAEAVYVGLVQLLYEARVALQEELQGLGQEGGAVSAGHWSN